MNFDNLQLNDPRITDDCKQEFRLRVGRYWPTAGEFEPFAAIWAMAFLFGQGQQSDVQPEAVQVPQGATHYQPHQKAYYKRLSATEWELWSERSGWIPSKGTSDSSEWVMLNEIAAAPQPPAQSEEHELGITINGYQLAAALEFIAPDREPDQMESFVHIKIAELTNDDGTKDPACLACCLDEYPEEGWISLSEDAPEQAQAEARGDESVRFPLSADEQRTALKSARKVDDWMAAGCAEADTPRTSIAVLRELARWVAHESARPAPAAPQAGEDETKPPRAFRIPEPGTPWWQTAKDCGAWTDRQDGDVGYVHFGSVEALRVYTMKVCRQAEAGALASQPMSREGLSQAARDVLAERRRQIEAEGWTPEHDDGHPPGELSSAAESYAAAASEQLCGWDGPLRAPQAWPWERDSWKPEGCRQNLVKAGALILAELERLDRASAHGIGSGSGKGVA